MIPSKTETKYSVFSNGSTIGLVSVEVKPSGTEVHAYV